MEHRKGGTGAGVTVGAEDGGAKGLDRGVCWDHCWTGKPAASRRGEAGDSEKSTCSAGRIESRPEAAGTLRREEQGRHEAAQAGRGQQDGGGREGRLPGKTAGRGERLHAEGEETRAFQAPGGERCTRFRARFSGMRIHWRVFFFLCFKSIFISFLNCETYIT